MHFKNESQDPVAFHSVALRLMQEIILLKKLPRKLTFLRTINQTAIQAAH